MGGGGRAEETDEEWMDKAVPQERSSVQVLPVGPIRPRRCPYLGLRSKIMVVAWLLVERTLLSWLAGSVRMVDVHATPVRATGRLQGGGSSVQDGFRMDCWG